MNDRTGTSSAAGQVDFAALGVGSWEWDIRSKEITWSRDLLRIYGLEGSAPREAGLEAFLDLVHPDDRGAVAARVSDTLARGLSGHEQRFRIVRPDGTVVHLLSRARLLRGADGAPERMVGIDVDLGTVAADPSPAPGSETTVDEEALVAAEVLSLVERAGDHDQLDAIYRAAPLGLALFDREHRFVRINAALAEINGPSVEEHLGRVAWDVVPDLKAVAEPLFRKVFQTGEAVSGVAFSGVTPREPDRLRHWLEHIYPVPDPDGRIGHIGVIVEEVTRRKDAEDRLDERETLLEALFASIDEGYCLCEIVVDGAGRPADVRIHEANGVLSAILGTDDAVGRTVREMVPDLEAAWIDTLASAALERERLRVEKPVAGLGKTLEVFAAPARPNGRFVAVVKDVTAARAAEWRLRESERRLASALRAGRLGVWDYDPRTGALEWDGIARALFRAGEKEPVSPSLFESSVHPHDLETVRAAIARSLDPDERAPYALEFRAIDRADGRILWLRTDATVTFEDGVPVRMVGTVADVTERREAEELQRLLIHEVDHRAKNLLAVVKSIVRLTPAHSLEAFVGAINGRIQALDHAHALLSEASWKDPLFGELMDRELSAWGRERVGLSGETVRLPADMVQPLALALHELATNAAKYGALSVSGGRLDVAWQLDGAGDLAVTWRESGGPPAAPPDKAGFGTRVVTSAIEQQLGGTLDWDWGGEGLVCRFTVPAARLGPNRLAGEDARAASA